MKLYIFRSYHPREAMILFLTEPVFSIRMEEETLCMFIKFKT